VTAFEDIAGDVELLLVMSVNPGFGGQQFIPRSLEKLARCHAMIAARQLSCDLEVDGGVTHENAGAVVAAGATILVAGSAVYDSPDGVAAAIGAIRRAGINAQPMAAR
jgi:ribulose-phosphate 3-epimerase